MITKNKRKEMENMIYTTFSKLDPSGSNVDMYKSRFSKMTDIQFDAFFKNFFEDEDMYLILDTIDYERDLKIEHIEDAAKYLNVPLFEHVAIPFENGDTENPIITKYKVPVGYYHIKRPQQLLSKKNSTSTDISERSALTGQVVGRDKNGRESDNENVALLAINADNILKELLGPRADDIVMKQEMYSQIAKKGFVSLDELPNNVKNKTSLNTLDVYLTGMGIKSDLIYPTDIMDI